MSTTLTPLERLIRLVETLRGADGCPWDREQTPRSISVYLVEEVYELIDAIESDDPQLVCEELGDVLFHIIFIARIYEELNQFDIARAANLICDKMIRRHPHVFDGGKVANTEQIRERWHAIKKIRKGSGIGRIGSGFNPGSTAGVDACLQGVRACRPNRIRLARHRISYGKSAGRMG